MWSRMNYTFDQERDFLIATRNLNPEKFGLMLQAYRKYWNHRVSLDFTDEEIAAIPKEMYMSVLSREVDGLWSRLPAEYREDTQMQKYRRCWEHHNTGRVHVEGPAPMRKNCVLCMRENVSALTQELYRLHAL